MALPNIFETSTVDKIIERLNNLSHDSKPLWGKMNAPQMLAHLNVTYDLANGKKSTNANFILKFILKTFIKNTVVNENPYKKSSQTAPIFIISEERDFDKEKTFFISHIKDAQSKGASYFEGKKSDSFGKLSSTEWNNMFYKHVNHHFEQFGI